MAHAVTEKSFKKMVKGAHLLEYWEAAYRKPYPDTGAVPHLWKWKEMKELLQQTTQFIGIEEAERRGLILVNPGLDKPYLTPTLFADIQLLMPGEKAPAHRHTSSASRLFMEGSGYTVVEGERCHMGPGDLVINPSWYWHDHGNEGQDEITYLNVLDIPLVETLGCIFYDHDYKKEGDLEENFQSTKKPLNASERLFRRGGLFPKFLRRPDAERVRSPQLVYKWEYARERLEDLKEYEGDPYDGVILEYVNPETGGSVQPTMSFNVQLLRPNEQTGKHRHTSSAVYWVVEGEGHVEVDDQRLEWQKNDVFVLPSWVPHRFVNGRRDIDATFLSVTDEPAVKALSLYREEAEKGPGEFVSVVRE